MLELGAGIGRFTGDLAEKAGQLTALDFVEGVIKKVRGILPLRHLNFLFLDEPVNELVPRFTCRCFKLDKW